MKRFSFLTILVLLFLAGCQVKSEGGGGVVENHNETDAVFKVTTTLNKTHATGSNLDFKLTFPRIVTVTGTPQISVTIGATVRTATYFTGTGTKILTFRYTIVNGDNDSNGVILANPIDLNGGTLKYDSTKDCDLNMSIPSLTTVLVDTTQPTILSVTPPSPGTYTTGMALNYTVHFSEPVVVTGSPRFPLTVGAASVNASYVSGSGSSNIVFRYTVQGGDSDSDGVTTGALALNGGTIKDVGGNMADITHGAINTSLVILPGSVPVISSVTLPLNGTYEVGQTLSFTVIYNQPVVVTLVPRIAITLTTGTVYANYVSGGGTASLVFSYTVQNGDSDYNGITMVSPLELNGGAIQNLAMTLNASLTYLPSLTPNIKVDGIDPVITSVDAPLAQYYRTGQNLDFVVHYDGTVNVTGAPRIPLTIGGSSVYATYLSGSGTADLVFRYVVLANQLDLDGITLASPVSLNGGTIKDLFGDNAGLTFTSPDTSGVLVDAVIPTITSVTGPAPGTYVLGQALDFVVNTSENITVTNAPRIQVTIGSSVVYADYASGTGSNALIFSYTVANGDYDNNGITIASPIALNGGMLNDDAGNALTLTYTPPNLATVLVDANTASITSVTPPANAKYVTGNNLDFTVTFTRAVTVSGTPRIPITIGSQTVYADYLSGSTTTALIFRYTVVADDEDSDGIAVTSPVDLNGGTIQDSTPQNATLTFTAPNTSGVTVDGIDLVITSVTPPSDDTYIYTESVDFIVNYNNKATVTGSPRIQLTVGAATLYATYLSGSGTNALTFRYAVGGADVDADGIDTVGPNLSLNAGTIKDAFGDNASLAFTAGNLPNVKVEGTVPTITSVTGPANGTYYDGNNLDFVVNLSELVNVTGTPRIALTIGATTKYAVYQSGTGTAALTFRYTVAAGDSDYDGIASASPLDLNGGTLADPAGNVVNPLTFTPPNTSLVNVDANNAVIVSVTPPANAKYNTTNNLDFSVQFSRTVNVTGSPRIGLTVGAATLYANYLSGTGTNTLVFRYTVAAGDKDTDGILMASPIALNGGTIQDSTPTNATLTFTVPNTSGILVDGIDLAIASITPPADDIYILGENLDFTVNYNYAATVTGTPRIQLTVGAATKYATYVSGTGTTALLFRYTVAAADDDQDGVTTVGPNLDLNGGTIVDDFNDNASLAFTAGNLANVKVDAVAPTISSVAGTAPGTFYENDNLDFTVTFSETVVITGTPRISLTIGAATRYATYQAGSGSPVVTFRYTVVNGDVDNDGLASSSPLDLNGGTIADLAGNAVTPLTFTPPNTALSYVDATAATILTLTAPANAQYVAGNDLDFTANYSRPVTVTGSPRIAVTLGAATVYANYQSGSGTATLIFRYTVAAGDEDLDGIALTSPVDLNGGTMKDSSTNNASLTFTAPNTTGVTVDAIDLVIASITPPANATYLYNQNLDFTVNYNYNAYVTGTPRIQLTVGAATRYATYQSGSGSTALVFRYTVGAADVDANGIDTVGPNLDLNSGTIKDNSGDNASLAFTAGNLASVLVEGTVPTISSVAAPANGTYYEAENLDFVATFSEAVNITGSPRITLTVGATTKYAVYQSGTGTATVTFRYTVDPGDTDANGIASSSPLDLNSGTIADLAGNALNPLTFTPPNTSGVNVDANNATIIAFNPPANSTYKTGNNVDTTVQWSRAVNVTGTPRIAITVGAATVYANYLSGTGTDTLTFRYTITAGDKDTDGVTLISPIDLNGGTIKDSSNVNAVIAYTVPNTSGVLFDGIDLTIASVTPPADATYLYNQNVDFVVNYNYPATVTGSPRIQLTVGAATRYATYQSGTGTTALTFRYTVGATDVDTDGIDTVGPNLDLNSGTIKDDFNDNASLAFTAANYPNKKVDGVVPTISSVTPPTNGTYYEAENLDFVVNFSEAVNVTGSPRITLTIGAATKYAVYQSGTGTAAVTFRYAVANGDTDSNGIASASPLDLNSGTIADLAGNALNPLTFTPPNTSAVNVDANNASILSVTPPANSTYKTGNNVDFAVLFSRTVNVTGTPRIAITVGAATVYATYLSGSGSTTLNFRYTITAGDKDNDGVALTSPVDLNSGTIKDSTNNNATLTYTAPNTSAINFDGIDLAIASITPPADATYLNGQNLDFTVNYNYAATVTGSPRIQLTVGAATKYATYQSGSGSTALVFRYTVGGTDVDLDGIDTVGPNLGLNGGTIKDDFNDNADLAFTAANYPGKLVEGTVPTISSVTGPAGATYNDGENLDFVATFSEAVYVTGSPRIPLTVGSSSVYATYQSGTGSNTITFRYTVQPGDYDGDGVALASPVDLNSGTINDNAGNGANPLTFTPPSTATVLVDATTATILSVTPPANATYDTATNLDFAVNFSRIVNITGTPRIALTVGAATVYANYTSGSGTATINFRYTVVAGNEDSNGIAMTSPIDLNGGTIRDASTANAVVTYTAPNTSSILVDGIDLTIASVTPPADDTYILAENLDFTVNYNYAATVSGTPRIQLTIGAATRYATYQSGSGTTALVFRYTVGATDVDNDGIDTVGPNIDLNGGTIQDAFADAASLAFTAANYPNKKVDGVVPTISTVAGPAPGTYYEANDLDFVVTFSESMTVTGNPRIALTIGAATKYATYTSGTGTPVLTFRYTVIPGDEDTDGIASTSPIQLNSGTLVDLNGNAISDLTFTPPNTTLTLVDATTAGILSVTPPANGTYKTGNNMDFTANFSRPVTITGTPRIGMAVGGSNVYLNYQSGSGTAAIVFRYTVQSGDNDINGVDISSPVDLNGGTIKDSSNNNATLTYTLPNTSAVLVDGIDLAIASVVPPADGTYINGQNVNFTINFNQPATITGSPRLALNVGGATRYATYNSGSGSTALVFRYTVGATDVDADGIASIGPALDLNGGTIKDAYGDDATITFTAASYALIFVEGTIPTISSVAGPSPATYYEGENLDFVVTYSESINATGSPRIALTIGATTRYATYNSGTGTSIHTYRYTIQAGDADTNGIAVANVIDLNSGSLKDLAGNDVAPLTFTAPNTALVNVDTNTATILTVTPPANATYQTGNSVDFSVTYSRPVNITGIPRIAVSVGGPTRYAQFVSDTSASIKLFRYIVQAGDDDNNGVVLSTPLELNGGTIKDSSNNNADLNFTLPDTSGILMDGIDLAIASVTAPADATYKLGQNMDFTVNYNYNAYVTGTPRIQLTVGAATLYATYVSGSASNALVFRYTVGAGEEDTDGVDTVGPNLGLNGGTIKDNFGDNALIAFTAANYANKKVDGVVPTIASVTGPVPATYYEDGNLDFVVNTSEAVTVTGSPRIQLTIGAATKYAVYSSGSGTTSLTFRYTVASGDVDSNGIASASPIELNSGTLKDAAGNDLTPLTFSPPDTSAVNCDAVAATLVSVSAPANATYKTTNNVDFTATFSRPVTVTGTPRITLTVGATTLYANYNSGSGTTALVFRYTVGSGAKDLDGIALTSPVDLNGGSIKDSANTSASLTYTAPNTAGILIDGIDLAISTVTPPADANYLYNQNLDFTVTFNDNATVAGSPRIQLTVGGATRYATYTSGSGTTSLVFRYTVGAADYDNDGIDTVGPNIDLNSGTIKDAFTDNATSLAITGTNYPNKKVDGIVPTISSVTGPSAATYHQDENADFIVNYSEAVTVTGSPRIQLTVGAATKYATYTSGSGTTAHTFRYTVALGDADNDGIAVTNTLQLNSGTLKDASGNDVNPLTFTAPDTSAVLIDGSGAYITSVTAPSNSTYKTSNNVDFTVNYSRVVNVTGTPRIAITLTSGTVYANYNGGTGTTALSFRYTVGAGEYDADGIVLASTISLNGGTMLDPSSNAAGLSFTPPTTTGILVDGIDVSISSITPPADATYKAGENMDFVVNFNYPATITGSPRIQLTVGASTLYATYNSGSGTSAVTFRYAVLAGHNDSDGITTVGPSIGLNGGTIRDSFGDNATLTFTGTNYPNKKVDAVLPTISSVAAPANATYISSSNVDFTVTMSEIVTITGNPRLTLTVGAATRYAIYNSGSGTNTIVFRYNPTVGDLDTNGIAMNTALDANGGSVADSAGNVMTNFALTPPTLTGVLIDAVVPTISSITGPAATTYGLAANLNFTVNFSETVTVTGTPVLALNVGGAAKSANYVSGSGSSALVFRYTVVTNDYDTNGVDTTSPITVVGATIRDSALNNATLTFTGSNYAGVNVDALPPAVSSVTVPTAGSYKPAANLDFTVTFNKVVNVTGTPRIELTIGSTTRYATYNSGTGTTALVFRYTLVADDDDYDGISANSTLQLNGGTIRDALLNNASTTLGTMDTSDVFTIPTTLTYWYDLSSTTTVGSSSSTLTQFSSKATTLNGTITGTPAYAATGFNGGSSAFTTLSNTNYVSLSTMTVKYIIFAYRAPNGGTGKRLIVSTGGGSPASRPKLSFEASGSLSLGTGCGATCMVYNGTSWTSTSSGNVASYAWTSNGYRMIVADFNGASFTSPQMGEASYDGQVAEVFIFTGSTAVADSVINKIGTYLNAKHGTNY